MSLITPPDSCTGVCIELFVYRSKRETRQDNIKDSNRDTVSSDWLMYAKPKIPLINFSAAAYPLLLLFHSTSFERLNTVVLAKLNDLESFSRHWGMTFNSVVSRDI